LTPICPASPSARTGNTSVARQHDAGHRPQGSVRRAARAPLPAPEPPYGGAPEQDNASPEFRSVSRRWSCAPALRWRRRTGLKRLAQQMVS
jgi:hypothetical protein